MTRYQRWIPWWHALAVGAAAGGAYFQQAGTPQAGRLVVIMAIVVAVSRGAGWFFGHAPTIARRRRPLREDVDALWYEAEHVGLRLERLVNEVGVLVKEAQLLRARFAKGDR